MSAVAVSAAAVATMATANAGGGCGAPMTPEDAQVFLLWLLAIFVGAVVGAVLGRKLSAHWEREFFTCMGGCVGALAVLVVGMLGKVVLLALS